METTKIVDGKLEITETQESIITTYTKGEIIGKIAEAQTKIDHIDDSLPEAETEKSKWEAYLIELESNK